jgi:hypothetical protein
MKEIRNFLSKVLVAENISSELRKEALQLRDTIDLCSKLRKNVGVITNIGFSLTYPGTINGEKDVTLAMVKNSDDQTNPSSLRLWIERSQRSNRMAHEP